MRRLFQLLEEVAWHVDAESPIRNQLVRLQNTVATSDFDADELAELARAAERVERAIAHHVDWSIP